VVQILKPTAEADNLLAFIDDDDDDDDDNNDDDSHGADDVASMFSFL